MQLMTLQIYVFTSNNLPDPWFKSSESDIKVGTNTLDGV